MAIIASIPPTLAAIAALVLGIRNGRKVSDLHVLVNSRLTELLDSSSSAARAQGKEEGRLVARAEDKDRRGEDAAAR